MSADNTKLSTPLEVDEVSEEANEPVIIKDEMNFAEFAGIIFRGAKEEEKLIVFEEHKTNFASKSRTRNRLEVSCSVNSELPIPIDQKVLLAVLTLAARSSSGLTKIFFTQWELLNELGWGKDGRSYRRLKDSLNRLSSTELRFNNLWYSNGEKRRTSSKFNIISEIYFGEAYREGKRVQDADKGWLVLPSPLVKSIQDGFVKSLRLDYVRKLSDHAIFLYRLLDKHFWKSAELEYDLIELASRIGVERTKSNSLKRIRQRVQKYGEELITIGYLVYFNVTRVKRGEYVVTTCRAGCDPLKSAKIGTVEARLIDHGVSPHRASSLVEENGEERVLQVLRYFETDVLVKKKTRINNPGGWLSNAINDPEFNIPETKSGHLGQKQKAVKPKLKSYSGDDVYIDDKGYTFIRR